MVSDAVTCLKVTIYIQICLIITNFLDNGFFCLMSSDINHQSSTYIRVLLLGRGHEMQAMSAEEWP